MEDMGDLMSKVSDMLNSDSMPDELKDLVKNLSGSNTSSENASTPSSGIDMATLLKLKSAMDKVNTKEEDPRSNLLYSLKPYLSPKKKGKVDQYVKLFNMSKMIGVLDLFGGEKNK